jgi:pimeloyl-ACP methyl ester carboxylesterase
LVSLVAALSMATAATSAAALPDASRWGPCSDAVEAIECAALEVPLDYEDPDSATIHLPLRRIRAVDDARRQGVLVTITGGPGQRGTDGVRPGAHTPAIERSFDIVSWDPRGTSQESLIDCIPDWDPFMDLDRTPDTASEQDALDEHIAALAGGCREAHGNLLPYVGTHEAALDLEQLRQFLGESQISILGSSYGSHVALLYATLFPEHVRAVVVDGYSDPNLSPGEREIEQAAAFERELESLLAACATDPECVFHSDGAPGETLDRLMGRLDRSPLPLDGDGVLSQSDAYESIAGSLVLDGDGRERLLEALAAADDRRGRSLDDIANGIRRSYEWSGLTLGAFMAVYCADSAAYWDSLSAEEVDGITARVREVAPRLGAFLWSPSTADDLPPVGLCAMQPHLAPRSTAPVDAAGAGLILVLATTGDPTTPITAARRSLHDLEEAVLLPVEADQHLAYHHAVSRPEGPTQRCVIDAVEAYLIALEPPIRGWACPSEGRA